MKKIFTLIAVAAMAMSANAQGSYGLQDEENGGDGMAIPAGTQITSVSNITMTYGDTGAAEFTAPAKHNKLNSLLGATAYTPGNGTNGNKPNGTIYYFEPTKAGVLTVGAVIGAGKAIIVKKDNYQGEDVAYKVVESDGTTEVTVSEGKLEEKTYGAIVVNVEAGVKYAIGLAGSKMGYYGFKYEVSEVDGITAVKAAQANDGVIYNLAGQKVSESYKGVVIKNGKKSIQ